MSNPRVSVLLGAYNASAYLREAVKSLLAQTFRDFELLAIDDGSTDDTLAILNEYARTDDRVRVITHPNAGLVKVLNEGLAVARGELVARMDADDVCLPHRFERQVAYLEQHPECVLVGSRVLLIDPQGRPICDMDSIRLTHDDIDAALLSGGWPIVHPSVIMRKRAVLDAGGYVQGYFPIEDHHLFLRLAEVGKLANLDEILLKYRRHPQSSVRALGGGLVQRLRDVVTDAQRRRGMTGEIKLPAHPIPPPTLSQLHKQWAWSALRAGNLSTARHHALRFARREPLDGEAWRLLACVIRGR
ncbi:MAG: glycosyltransferase [Tepidisphaeraceae bacterium]